MRSRLPSPATLAVLLLAALAPPAAAQSTPTEVRGTEGRDEIVVEQEPPPSLEQKGGAILVFGAASASGCTPATDLVSGRVSHFRCDATAPLSIAVGGGDDAVSVTLKADNVTASVRGEAGNDTLAAAGGIPRLEGGDGDDTLAAPAGAPSDPGVLLDGGNGRDLADYGGVRGVSVTMPGSAVATIAVASTGQGTFFMATRSDTLRGIERVAGSSRGDRLVGSTAGEELLGLGGDDVVRGGDGNDTLDGGPGSDEVNGGGGADAVTGGPGLDDFPKGSGGDTYNARDGFRESIGCAPGDVAVVDLVDAIVDRATCGRVDQAAARHLIDTAILGISLAGTPRPGVLVRLACPAAKPEPCAGRLTARRGGDRGPRLGAASYRLRPGRKAALLLPVSAVQAAGLRGRAVTVTGAEVDDTGRPRSVTRRVTLR